MDIDVSLTLVAGAVRLLLRHVDELDRVCKSFDGYANCSVASHKLMLKLHCLVPAFCADVSSTSSANLQSKAHAESFGILGMRRSDEDVGSYPVHVGYEFPWVCREAS